MYKELTTILLHNGTDACRQSGWWRVRHAHLSAYLFVIGSALCFLLPVCSNSQKAEIVLQSGPASSQAVAFSPNNQIVACGSSANTVTLWEVRTGQVRRILAGHNSTVDSIAFSPDGQYIASGSFDSTVKLWNVETGQMLRSFDEHKYGVTSVAFSSDGQLLASGGFDEVVYIRRISDGKLLHTLAVHQRLVNTIAISPNGRWLASGGNDATIVLWDMMSGKQERVLSSNQMSVSSIAFSPDSQRMVSGGVDNVKLWEVATGKELQTLIGQNRYIYSVAFHPNGNMVASASGDSTISLWDVSTGRSIRSLTAPGEPSVYSVAFSYDGKLLASTGTSQQLWELKTGKLIRSLKGRSLQIQSVAFSPDANLLAVGTGDARIQLWDMVTGRIVRELVGHSSDVNAVAWASADLLVSGSSDNSVRVWDVTTGRTVWNFQPWEGAAHWRKMLRDLHPHKPTVLEQDTVDGPPDDVGHSDSVECVTLNPEGSILASGSKDHRIKLWNIKTGKLIRTLTGHSGDVLALAFSPHGNLLASADSDAMIRLWNPASGEALHMLKGHQGAVPSIAFSPNGKQLVSGGMDSTVRLWDAVTGQEISRLSGHRSAVNAVTFSPNGQLIATGSTDQTIGLWNPANPTTRKNLLGHTREVTAVSFSPDGRFLASGSGDKTLGIWDVASGQLVASFIAVDGGNDSGNQPAYLTLTPDHYYMGSRSAFRTIAFRLGDRVYPFEQLDLYLNRPDIVLSRLGRASQTLIDACAQARRKRFERIQINIPPQQMDFHLPTVAVIGAPPPVATETRKLSFRIKAQDSKYLLERINFYVNNGPIYGTGGLDIHARMTTSVEQGLEANLSAGDNKVEVSVMNQTGAESLRATFRVAYTGPVVQPNLYVVAIGVSQYKKPRYNLQYAEKDARDIYQRLTNQTNLYHQTTWPGLNPLTNEQATRENILATKQVLMKSQPDDTIVLFFSGHGLLDKKYNYYFGTYDIDAADPQARGVEYGEIQSLLDGVPARNRLVLMDTCHAGEVDRPSKQDGATQKNSLYLDSVCGLKCNQEKRQPPFNFVNSRGIDLEPAEYGKLGLSNSFLLMQQLFADLDRGEGAYVIAAARGVDLAFEQGNLKNGAFTRCVLEALEDPKRARQESKEGLTVRELRNYVLQRVVEITNGKQQPAVRQENLESNFRVY